MQPKDELGTFRVILVDLSSVDGRKNNNFWDSSTQKTLKGRNGWCERRIFRLKNVKNKLKNGKNAVKHENQNPMKTTNLMSVSVCCLDLVEFSNQ